MADPGITIYGTRWCGDCVRSKSYLDQNGIAYYYIDIEKSPEAAETVMRLNDGMKSVPTIIFPDDSVLTEPGNRELGEKLGII